jgi:RNA polymerase sigma-70 factor (ECF subfamily)
MAKPIIDERIVEACRRGDGEALRLLFEAHNDRVYSIALCFCDGNESAARDITQDVFIKVMTKMEQFENRSEFATWLYRIVANSCLDWRRSLRRFLPFGNSGDVLANRKASQEATYIRHEIEASVRKVIATMTPKLRITILLKYFEDLSYEEIAGVLRCSTGTVASRLNRGHQILARRLAHLRGALGSGE